jgi:hypothetical protein
MLGVSVPKGMDGRVLSEIFNADFRPTPPTVQHDSGSPGSNGDPNADGLTEEDKAILLERLRNLGYVG